MLFPFTFQCYKASKTFSFGFWPSHLGSIGAKRIIGSMPWVIGDELVEAKAVDRMISEAMLLAAPAFLGPLVQVGKTASFWEIHYGLT